MVTDSIDQLHKQILRACTVTTGLPIFRSYSSSRSRPLVSRVEVKIKAVRGSFPMQHVSMLSLDFHLNTWQSFPYDRGSDRSCIQLREFYLYCW